MWKSRSNRVAAGAGTVARLLIVELHVATGGMRFAFALLGLNIWARMRWGTFNA